MSGMMRMMESTGVKGGIIAKRMADVREVKCIITEKETSYMPIV